jgi:hypothetical protein
MKYEKWFRQIVGPRKEEFNKDVDIILVGLAGYFGKESKMRKLAHELKTELDTKTRTIAPVWGVGRFSSKMRNTIAKRLRQAITRTKADGGKAPKIIFIGKSMGATVLRDVCMKLSKDNIPIDLFVVVDASKRPDFHYQSYINSNGNTYHAMQFPHSVARLVNLHEWRKKKGQNGHPCLYYGTREDFPAPPYIDLSFNINVHHHGFNKQTLSVDPGSQPITQNNPHHISISENDDVIGVVKEFVRRAVQ